MHSDGALSMKPIGSVSTIARYPVKSMAGEEIASAFLGFAGILGDRAYAFVQVGGRKGFPWFTIRDLETLVLYKARFRHPEMAQEPIDAQVSMTLGPGVASLYPGEDAFDVEVETPEGEYIALRDPKLKEHLESETGKQLTLRYSERSLGDCRPVSIFSNNSLVALEDEIGIPLDRHRFRANFYVEWHDVAPYYENGLVGRTLKIGERAQIRVTERDPRCKIITIDPETADENPKILRHISSTHGGTAGVYGAVLAEGIIRAGDPIYLMEP